MDNFRRTRYITENFLDLQGLRLVPFGVFLLYMGLHRLILPAEPPPHAWLYIALPLALAFAAKQLIGRYYSRRFGQVTYSLDQRADRVQKGIIAVAIAVPVVVGAVILTERLESGVNFGTLIGALVFVVLAYRQRLAQWPGLGGLAEFQLRDDKGFYLALAGFFLLWSLLPLYAGWGPTIIDPSLPIGMAQILIGTRNHFTFVANVRAEESVYEAAI